jgi:hypothetical protein
MRDWHNRGAGDNKTNYAALLGLPNPFGAVNFPTIDGMSLGNADPYVWGGEQPFFLVSNLITAQDNATKVVGKHEFSPDFSQTSNQW